MLYPESMSIEDIQQFEYEYYLVLDTDYLVNAELEIIAEKQRLENLENWVLPEVDQ